MINVAIIGTGAIASAHIRAYQQFLGRCNVVAMCDIYPEKAEKSAKSHNLNVDIYSDYQEMLQRRDIYLVSVCTPPYTHAELSIAFLNAGKHVLVEKPMASSLEECDAMNVAQRKSGKILSVVSQNRFTNPMVKLKAILDTKLMGPIVHT